MRTITVQLQPAEYAVCRLAPSESLPTWAGDAPFLSVTRTAEELSIVCPALRVPAGVKHEAGWRLLKFQGPFAFTETGILSSALAPLAAAKISILALATFDTDYLLVKQIQLDAAIRALTSAGHALVDAG